MGFDKIEWQLDGRPVDMGDDWSATMVAPGGYKDFTGFIPASQLRASFQGSELVGYRPNGQVLFYGRLPSPPKVETGLSYLHALGPSSVLERRQSRFLVTARDLTQWVDATSDPHRYAEQAHQKFEVSTADGALSWTMHQGEPFVLNDEAGVVFWAQGMPLTRIAATYNESAATVSNDFEVRIDRAVGPDGALTNFFTSSGLNSGDVIDQVPSDDLIRVRVRSMGSHTPTAAERIWLTDVRVNGFLAGDDITTSQIIASMASQAGFNTSRISDTGVLAGSFDWLGSWSAAFDSLQGLDNYRWLALWDPTLGRFVDYGPWSPDVTRPSGARLRRVSSERHANFGDLEPLEVFNKMTVRWRTSAGVVQSISEMASPDPLEATGEVNEFLVDIGEQPGFGRHPLWHLLKYEQYRRLNAIFNWTAHQDEGVARTLIAAQLPYFASRRVQGSLDVFELASDNGPDSAHALRAGDTIELTNLIPVVGAQRVVGVTYSHSKNGPSVRAELSNEFPTRHLLGPDARAPRESSFAAWRRLAQERYLGTTGIAPSNYP